MHHILDVTTRAVIAYLNAQIEAGAQAVMVFDSWGGVLAHDAYHEFSLAYLERIAAGLIRQREERAVPSIVVLKGWRSVARGHRRRRLQRAVGLDWTVDLGKATYSSATRSRCGQPRPCGVVRQPPRPLPNKPAACWTATAITPGHVFNLGHGISQYTVPDNVSVLVETVH